ncbi:TerB [Sinorhizobium meliloti]|nr:TerB [Sinorhizobium meliloti]
MGLFSSVFKSNAKEAINKFAGNTDYLEGMSAACALVAAAEGGIDDAEYDKTVAVIRANSAISSAFNAQQIESTFSRMTPKTATRSGKSELKNEIREVIARDKTGQMGTAILLACLDVADEGGIGAQEEAVMRDIATICNVSYDKLAAG